jgi:hypothetical protein
MTALAVTPVTSALLGLAKALLVVEKPLVPVPVIPVCFNPTQYRIEKANTFAEIPIPGLEAPPIQFIRGNTERLSLDLLVDTTDTLLDVRLRYTDQLRGLLDIQSELHAPAIVRFVWDRQIFRGVIESLGITFVLFTPEGVPLRAQLALALKEYRPIEEQVAKAKTSSPDVDKAYTIRRGDTLSGIAQAAYGDPARWREIAAVNRIDDPRRLEPGRVLRVPRLRA